MIKLLIIADDFTGALDTGVQFAESGASTKVSVSMEMKQASMDEDVEVLVLDAETRHMLPEKAYDIVKSIVLCAKKWGIPNIYKKTDSALRGNIGAELAALYDAVGENVHFIPAFPLMGRTTCGGVHYINGTPVSESMFGKDPYEPVKQSEIKEIIKVQTDTPTAIVDTQFQTDEDGHGILIYDCAGDEQLKRIGMHLQKQGGIRVCAGCAGFASILPELLKLDGKCSRAVDPSGRLLVVCGSVNPITKAQLSYAERAGSPRVYVKPEYKLDPDWGKSAAAQEQIHSWIQCCKETGICILDSNDPNEDESTLNYGREHQISREMLRVGIAEGMGRITKMLLDEGCDATLMITGGDTLLGFMKQIGVNALLPLYELEPGTVLSGFDYGQHSYYVISKSGGFGKESLIEDLKHRIVRKE